MLVLDLSAAARGAIGEQRCALAPSSASTTLEALHFLAGPDRATVPEQWATVPTRTPERAPGLVHWADPVKPWHERRTPERALWRRHAEALRRRPAR